ncbi:MAG: hypothetical protein CMP34_00605 [Rickettsiales bacterium]|nr:hypothetical protein [Rickettsiales bacterium]|tara:strand:+ start:443 stop:634 length:192 start_codon:yes stop_codon:yes gene_type:complete
MKKKMILVTDNSSWWKALKYRNESAKKLSYLRKSGWKLKKSIKLNKDNISIDTKSFKKYFFYK